MVVSRGRSRMYCLPEGASSATWRTSPDSETQPPYLPPFLNFTSGNTGALGDRTSMPTGTPKPPSRRSVATRIQEKLPIAVSYETYSQTVSEAVVTVVIALSHRMMEPLLNPSGLPLESPTAPQSAKVATINAPTRDRNMLAIKNIPLVQLLPSIRAQSSRVKG